jgi:hypothetical protein
MGIESRRLAQASMQAAALGRSPGFHQRDRQRRRFFGAGIHILDFRRLFPAFTRNWRRRFKSAVRIL